MSPLLKRKFIVLLAVAAVLLVPLSAQAVETFGDIFFTVGNTSGAGGLSIFNITGSYYADLHWTVPDGGGAASFTLTPGTGTYNGSPVTFAFMGTDPLGLNVKPSGSTFLLTPTNPAYTQIASGNFLSPGSIFVLQPTSGPPQPTNHFDGFGDFNTALNTDQGGYDAVMNKITFQSLQTNFPDANAVLAALILNGPDNLTGWLAVVDMAGAYTLPDGTINRAEGAIATGFAGNGTPSGGLVPVPPTAWLLGSGLVGLLLLGRRRKQG